MEGLLITITFNIYILQRIKTGQTSDKLLNVKDFKASNGCLNRFRTFPQTSFVVIGISLQSMDA